MKPQYTTNIEVMRMPGRSMKFTDVYPERPKNPDVRVGVWVRCDGVDGDWFVTAIYGDIAQIKTEEIINAEELEVDGETNDQRYARIAQAGVIRAKRTGDLTVVAWWPGAFRREGRRQSNHLHPVQEAGSVDWCLGSDQRSTEWHARYRLDDTTRVPQHPENSTQGGVMGWLDMAVFVVVWISLDMIFGRRKR
jgi:hypothetical protein